ncbi:unnamed protein product, partial [Iphiclides podalirius]
MGGFRGVSSAVPIRVRRAPDGRQTRERRVTQWWAPRRRVHCTEVESRHWARLRGDSGSVSTTRHCTYKETLVRLWEFQWRGTSVPNSRGSPITCSVTMRNAIEIRRSGVTGGGGTPTFSPHGSGCGVSRAAINHAGRPAIADCRVGRVGTPVRVMSESGR